MAIWEYKVISSGKGGFATPVMLEKFLNDLGKEEWEVIEFTTPADNPLAFSGLARRPTQRDWTLADAAAAAASAASCSVCSVCIVAQAVTAFAACKRQPDSA